MMGGFAFWPAFVVTAVILFDEAAGSSPPEARRGATTASPAARRMRSSLSIEVSLLMRSPLSELVAVPLVIKLNGIYNNEVEVTGEPSGSGRAQ